MLSEDDRNLRDMTPEELAAAWDLWFDLAQTTNDSDPCHEHGVFVAVRPRAGDRRASAGVLPGHVPVSQPPCTTPDDAR